MNPPKGFRPAGNVVWAKLMDTPPEWIKQRARGNSAQSRGIRYEKKAHKHFSSIYGCNYIPNPWIQFKNSQAQLRWAQPDALLFDFPLGILTIIEYKYQHTAQAWWQLVELYKPLVRKLYPQDLWRIRLLEITQFYDPHVLFPCEVTILNNVDAFFPDQIGVYIWKPSVVMKR